MRPQHPIRLGIATLAVTAALGAATALPAIADSSPLPSASPSATASPVTSPTASPGTITVGGCSGSTATVLSCIKQRSATAVANRETALQEMTTDINKSADTTSSDKATLAGQIQADETGLTSLNATIQADTSVKQAWTDAQTIVTGYRVYLLEAPKVHLVIAADTETTTESLIGSVMPAIQTAINDSTTSAAEKAAAQAAFNDCTSQLASAQSASSGVVSEVIDLLPSGYPDNQPTLAAARGSVTTAKKNLEQCRTDINAIRTDLGI